MDLIVPTEGLSYQEITVGAAAIGFSTALLQAAPPPRGAVLTLETASIRWRVDGGNPTAAVGHLMAVGDSIVLHGGNTLSRFRAIRTGVNGALKVTYLFA